MNDRPVVKRKWLMWIGAALVVSVGFVFVFNFFPEEEKELRRGLRNAVENTFPEQAARVAESFGLTRYSDPSPESRQTNPATPSVVLIHGLDDPGKVWMNLAPALLSENVDVWEMRYPNDQPIVESA